MEKNWFKRIMNRKLTTKQCDIHFVGCSETELVCDHKWELKFNSAMYIIGKKCRKCEQYIAY
jgi:hypothetical protein